MRKIPDVSVVIPVHNRANQTDQLLKALAAQTLEPEAFEVILVDDCSTDGTWEDLQRASRNQAIDLKIFRTPANTGGPAAPRNLGWRAARAPIVAFLDDDCLPEPEWLEAGLRAMDLDPRLGVLQGCTRMPPEIDIHSLQRWTVWRIVEKAGPYFEAANIFYRRAALDEVDGFDQSIVTWGEDTDLGWKVVDAGWGRSFAVDAVVVHEVERRGWRWFARFGFKERNVIRCAAMHPGFRQEAFWRPWAVSREDAAFALALVGAVGTTRWRPSALACLPYLVLRRPSIRRERFVRVGLQIVAVDAARFLGQVSGALTWRIFVV